MVIWLIGLAGAGKTTIGQELYARLKSQRPSVVFLDGDDVRAMMGNDLGHTLEDRRANAWRICRLCRFLDQQGIDVVCAILSIFHDTQDWNRENYSSYLEVYIKVPLDVLVARDGKGLYRRALAGELKNVVGVDLPFVPPPRADLVLDNAEARESHAAQVDRIIAAMEARLA